LYTKVTLLYTLVFASTVDLANNLYNGLSRVSKLDITNLGEIKEFLEVEIIEIDLKDL
jgi:hypothetical protein